MRHVTCWEGEGGKGRKRSERDHTNAPVFIIMCMDARGKMVAWPGVRTSVTSRAPFSWYMYVVVLPRTATTKLTALGCQWGGSIEQGPRFNMATRKQSQWNLIRESVWIQKRECVAGEDSLVIPPIFAAGKVAAFMFATPPGAKL